METNVRFERRRKVTRELKYNRKRKPRARKKVEMDKGNPLIVFLTGSLILKAQYLIAVAVEALAIK